ncbi:MAG: site-specific integrase [Magnetococcales bacterium]|nr:site-specific integrase [Magnetococcales bacterium]
MAHIQARKGKNGKANYRVQVRLKGHPTQTATFARKTDAQKWASQIESAIREGRHFRTSEAKRHTLGEAVDRYLRDVMPTKPKQAVDQTRQLKWWKSEIGDYTLADCTPALIAECRDKLGRGLTRKKIPRSPATVTRYLSALSHLFTIATQEWGWIETSPISRVRKPKEPRGRVRFLSSDERERLLKACQESPNSFLYVVVVLALGTGMRRGEIMTLRWPDVDLMQGRITLHQTKNDERRVIPLTGHPLSVLRDFSKIQRLDTDLLFPGKRLGKTMDLRAPWEAALKKAEIDDFVFHDLRHSAASELAMGGASLAEIAEVLGHKTLQMVKRYSHLSEAHTAGVVSKMNDRIFGRG